MSADLEQHVDACEKLCREDEGGGEGQGEERRGRTEAHGEHEWGAAGLVRERPVRLALEEQGDRAVMVALDSSVQWCSL